MAGPVTRDMAAARNGARSPSALSTLRSPALWTFAAHKGVEQTNNHVERALRSAVIYRELSLGNQSEAPHAARAHTAPHTAPRRATAQCPAARAMRLAMASSRCCSDARVPAGAGACAGVVELEPDAPVAAVAACAARVDVAGACRLGAEVTRSTTTTTARSASAPSTRMANTRCRRDRGESAGRRRRGALNGVASGGSARSRARAECTT